MECSTISQPKLDETQQKKKSNKTKQQAEVVAAK